MTDLNMLLSCFREKMSDRLRETHVGDAPDGGRAQDDDRGAVVVVDERPASWTDIQCCFEAAHHGGHEIE